ncbi:glycosyltransferase [bacterium]|nr:glycosyltransferase [bacterium]
MNKRIERLEKTNSGIIRLRAETTLARKSDRRNSVQNDREIVVSVLAIAYNHEPWVAKSLESLISQRTDFPIEILVHDDASTDRTCDIIREYERKYPGLLKGVYQSENQYSKGEYPSGILLGRARGKYIAICECDDYWKDPLKLQKQVELLESHPECSMAAAKTDVYQWENGRFNYKKSFEGVGKDLLYFEDIYGGCYLHTSTFLIPKKNFEFYAEYREKGFYGDTALRFIMLTLGPIAFLQKTVSVYQITGKGIWTSLDSYSMAASHIELFKKFYYHFDSNHKKYWARNLMLNYLRIITIDLKERRFSSIPGNLFPMVYFGMRHSPINLIMEIFGAAKRFVKAQISQKPISTA